MNSLFIYEDFDPTKVVLDEKIGKSNFSVKVLAIFKKDGKAFKMITFPLDQLVFVNIAWVMSTRCQVFPKLRMQLLDELAKTMNEGLEPDDEFYGLIVKCICCWIEAIGVYASLPPQNLGYKLTVDLDDPDNTRLWCGTEAGLEAAFNEIVENNKN